MTTDNPQDRRSALLHMITGYLDGNMSWRTIAMQEPFQAAGIHFASLNQWYRGERDLTATQRRHLGMTTPHLQYNLNLDNDPAFYARLETVRTRQGMSKSAVVREALEAWVQEKE